MAQTLSQEASYRNWQAKTTRRSECSISDHTASPSILCNVPFQLACRWIRSKSNLFLTSTWLLKEQKTCFTSLTIISPTLRTKTTSSRSQRDSPRSTELRNWWLCALLSTSCSGLRTSIHQLKSEITLRCKHSRTLIK